MISGNGAFIASRASVCSRWESSAKTSLDTFVGQRNTAGPAYCIYRSVQALCNAHTEAAPHCVEFFVLCNCRKPALFPLPVFIGAAGDERGPGPSTGSAADSLPGRPIDCTVSKKIQTVVYYTRSHIIAENCLLRTSVVSKKYCIVAVKSFLTFQKQILWVRWTMSPEYVTAVHECGCFKFPSDCLTPMTGSG